MFTKFRECFILQKFFAMYFFVADIIDNCKINNKIHAIIRFQKISENSPDIYIYTYIYNRYI